MSQLPGIAGEIAEEIGLDLTVKLLRERGGTEISIPTRARGTYLARVVGIGAAERLIARLGPGKVTLPCGSFRGEGARRARAIAMLRAGKSLREVALACDISLRTAVRCRAQMNAGDDRQGKLPL